MKNTIDISELSLEQLAKINGGKAEPPKKNDEEKNNGLYREDPLTDLTIRLFF